MSTPLSTRMSTRTIFADPWRRPSSPPRPVRSDSSESTSSSSSSSSRSSQSDPAAATAAPSAPQSRSGSVVSAIYPTGRSASVGSLATSSRRSSCYSILEAEEERTEFGAHVVGMLEPRNSLGWWGMKEVLEERTQE